MNLVYISSHINARYLFIFLLIGVASGRKRPCGDANVIDCLCFNEQTYTGIDVVKENCDRKENPIEYCNCDDGFKWTPRHKACKKANIIDCICEDGKTHIGKDEVKQNCKREDNPIKSCNCDDGFGWKPKKKPCDAKENFVE